MVPVHHTRNDQSFDVGKNCLEMFAFFRGLFGQGAGNRPWLGVRRDRQRFYFFSIISDPIRQSMKLFAKNCWRNISEVACITTQT